MPKKSCLFLYCRLHYKNRQDFNIKFYNIKERNKLFVWISWITHKMIKISVMNMFKLCLIIRSDCWNHPVAPIPPAMPGHGHPGCQDCASFQPQYSGGYHRLSGCNYADNRRRMVEPVPQGSCQRPTIGGGIQNKTSRKGWQYRQWKSGDDAQVYTAETHQTTKRE